jgi:hypothetical protein
MFLRKELVVDWEGVHSRRRNGSQFREVGDFFTFSKSLKILREKA